MQISTIHLDVSKLPKKETIFFLRHNIGHIICQVCNCLIHRCTFLVSSDDFFNFLNVVNLIEGWIYLLHSPPALVGNTELVRNKPPVEYGLGLKL